MIRYCLECGEKYDPKLSYHMDICNHCCEKEEGKEFMEAWGYEDNRIKSGNRDEIINKILMMV